MKDKIREWSSWNA